MFLLRWLEPVGMQSANIASATTTLEKYADLLRIGCKGIVVRDQVGAELSPRDLMRRAALENGSNRSARQSSTRSAKTSQT
jgi:hypothetical protein